MTALWFGHLRAQDRVSVKPHASPVLHAINHLLGELAAEHLTTLREFGGLQSYPSRAKDPDPVDYSTGSVGIGATAPIWGALARRYVGQSSDEAGHRSRQYSLVGDAELDEGACWEAVLDPMVAELGEVVWIVDLNRQSLDRVVPIIGATRLQGMFAAAGWQVLTVKYGRLLEELFTRPGGDALRARIDEMSNPEYQRLLRCTAAQLRERLPGDGSATTTGPARARRRPRRRHPARRDPQPRRPRPRRARRGVRRDRRHPADGDLRLHREGLRAGHRGPPAEPLVAAHRGPVRRARGAGSGPTRTTRGRRSRTTRPRPRCAPSIAARLRRDPVPAVAPPAVPADLGRTPRGTATTQAALGRALLDLTRRAPEAAAPRRHGRPGRQLVDQPRRLGQQGRGVGRPRARRLVRRRPRDDPALARAAHRPAPRAGHRRDQPGRAARRAGRHLEPLGPAAAADRGALRPVRRAGAGAVVVRHLRRRAVDPGRHAVRGHAWRRRAARTSRSRRPSVGLEQPGCVTYEPAFAIDVEWTLLASLARLGRPDGTSAYLRLSTRPGRPGASPPCRPTRPPASGAAGRSSPAPTCCAGAGDAPAVTIAAMGAIVPEALAAADRLADARASPPTSSA